ncbi:hypothetical protein ABDK96_10035 [Citricoccus nitrophenolicus]|uniref:Type I restriction modification DNA specificity domain-containing protein n=1 Tax=Citricoccus nitrophenolicus TaxID=863575 RepID=A0ABV0IIM6_9MICC
MTKTGVVEQLEDIAQSIDGAPKKLARAGDIVINSRSDRKGSSGLSPRDGSVSVINTVMAPHAIVPRYAHHLIRSHGFQEEFYRFGSGIVADLWSTRWSATKAITMPVPPIEEQHHIADYLDHETAEIDAFITGLERFRGLVVERGRAQRERAISGTGVEAIPLRRFAPVRTTGTSVNASPWPAGPEEYGVLKTGAVSKGYFDPSENKAVVDREEVKRLTSPVLGDKVLINRANTPSLVGTAVYVSEPIPCLFLSDKLWSIDFDASNEYMAEAMSTRFYRDQVTLSSVGASSSMHNLSYEDFLSVRIPVPGHDRQAQIAAELRQERHAERNTLEAIGQATHLAQERRAALISAAVTGQIDVTGRRRGPSEAERLEDELTDAQ